MATIARLKTLLIVETDPATRALALMQLKFKEFARDTTSTLKGIGGGMVGMFKSGLGGLFSLITSPFSFAMDFASKLTSKYSELRQEIDRTAKQSRRLGMSDEAYNAMKYGAELSGIPKMTLEVGLAALRRKAVGPLDEALEALADRYVALHDPMAKANLLAQNFGGIRTGKMFGTFLEDGAAGVRQWKKDTAAFGTALNAVDTAKIENANNAMVRWDYAVKGLWTRIVVALAPAVEYVADLMSRGIRELLPWVDKLGQGVEIAFAFFRHAGATMVEDFKGQSSAFANLIEMVEDFKEAWTPERFLAGFKVVAMALVGVFEMISLQIARLIDRIHSLVVKGQKAGSSVANAWKLPLVPLAMLEDAISGKNKNKAFLDEMSGTYAQGSNKITSAADAVKKWGVSGYLERLFDSFNLPAHAAKVKRDYGMSGAMTNYTQNPAAIFGSKEAYSIETRFRMRSMTDPLAVQRQQLEEQRKANKFLEKMVDKLDVPREVEVGVV